MSTRPLKELFDQLRKNGFPLGISEYKDFLSALEGRFLEGKSNTYESLKRLARLLWFTPGHSKELFDELFDLSWKKELEKRRVHIKKEGSDKTTSPDEDTGKEIDTDTGTDTSTTGPTPDPSTIDSSPVVSPPPVTIANPETIYWLSLKSSNIVVQPEDSEEEEILGSKAIRLGGGYFPIRPRTLTLIWRFLKTGGKEVWSNELDVPGTVERFVRKGGLILPVFQSRIQYDTRLIVLIDHSPSMAAFHDFSKWMNDAAPLHPFSHIPSTLYFSNVPEGHLYKGHGHQEGFSIRHIRGSFERKPLRIMIISDAGAARGRKARARIIATQRALRAIAPFTHNLVWVNPMPKHRWSGTSAEEISTMIPMVEASDSGMVYAVNILRGKVPQQAIGS